MNDSFDLQNPGLAARWIDRLVDGQLDDDQQRRLLVALEGQPDGWRRCALAFVEAQVWRRELRALTCDTGDSRCDTADPSRRSRVRWLAVAAGVLIAFGLGIAAGGMWVNRPAAVGGAAIAEQASPRVAPTATESLTVTIPSTDSQSEKTVQVPLIEADEHSWQTVLAQADPVLSDTARQVLEQMGHRIEQRRALYPLRLDDGREAVVPIDLVEVQYRGGWQ